MPWGDGTGPWWAQGKWRCRRPGYGMGPGRGYAMRRAYYDQPQERDSDATELEAYAKELEAEFEQVKRRLKEMKR